ncbi:MAG TPA: alpha/beta fold hydrolase, partial [Solirubrobacterales bacterium]|nr:alpha/beta fold hydrolase [Solirubrobacterales bacterium]
MTPVFTPFHHGGSGPPLVLIHGITDTWSTWELVIPPLERKFEVLAVTLPGHAGGPALKGDFTADTLPAGIEAAMDGVGFGSAHVAGNSLGGWVALRLAERGRALSVSAFAPVGGWSADFQERHAFDYFVTQQELVKRAAPFAREIAATPEGRRQATRFIVEDDSLITAEMVVRQL